EGPAKTSIVVPYRRSTSRQSAYVSGKRWCVSIAKTRAFGSSENSMSSSTDSSFWKEQASAARPENVSRQNETTSSAVSASTSGGSRRSGVAKEHLLQRVSAEAETQCLERDDLLRRDVSEVDFRPEVLHEPGLRLLGRRLPDEVVEVDRMLDLGDQAGPHVAVGAEDAGRSALARLGDHLPGPCVLLLADPFDPLVGREHDLGVLGADFREDGEV